MPQPSVPTVLITGSSGFLGQSIARGLLDRYRIIGLDLTQPKKPVAGVETIEINLTSDDDVATAMAEVRQRVGNRIASVIHLAAYYDTTGQAHPQYDADTAHGTRRPHPPLKVIETKNF